MIPFRAIMTAAAACILTTLAAHAVTVGDITRIKGEGEFRLHAVGLVVGLKGTGDDMKDPIIARPMYQLYKTLGNEPGSLKDFAKGKSVALVMLSCTIPEKGALADDALDVHVSVSHNASSLVGGRLIATPMVGIIPGQPVFAFAEGELTFDSPDNTTVARVRRGAVLIRDVRGPELEETFELLIDAPFMGFAAANHIATTINGKADPIHNSVAVAKNDRTIHITIPKAERKQYVAFLADVLGAEINPALLELPAQVVVNQSTGAIIITGDVQIRPTAITHKDLSITTITPLPPINAGNPQVTRTGWTDLKTSATPQEAAKLTDLIAAFKQLSIPVGEQVELLQMLHKSGQMQGKLIID